MLVFAAQSVGAIFAVFFITAYLGGLPSTEVLHSEPFFRIPLAVFGVLFLVLVLGTLILAFCLKEK